MQYSCARVWLEEGIARNVRLTLDNGGFIQSVERDACSAEAVSIPGLVIPGMTNAHSHAFQRALAGLTEYRAAKQDNFWTWRQAMYDFTGRLKPEDVFAIACQLYGEMLTAGYSHVVEFHYLHHRPGGVCYDPETAMADALIRAAEKTGIGLTLLPVIYQLSDFGGKGLQSHQKRFIYETNDYLALLQALQDQTKDLPNVTIGAAFHSLRAVPAEALLSVLQCLPASMPIHIHIAEQEKEVAACLAHTGKRPVDWLLDNAPVDDHWSLVHATHMTEVETDRLAKSGAVAVLCPTTEANLGDGLFPLPRYLEKSEAIAIGSDSHISVSPIEELRLLEYGQRLVHQARNVAAHNGEPHTGAALWTMAAKGGAQSAGIRAGRIAPGYRADLLVLDTDSPTLYGREGGAILDSLVFSGNSNPVRDVMVAGKWRVKNGALTDSEGIFEAYKETVRRLQEEVG